MTHAPAAPFPSDSPLSQLAAQNFRHQLTDLHRRTDRMFAWLMAIQYVLAIVFALVVSPRTWAGAEQQTHPHVWMAVLFGGLLASYPIYLTVTRPGEAYTRLVIAVSQALFSALLIHLTGGRIETHFHVFGSLAFLAFYRDWRVLVAASVVVAVDHLVRGLWYPFSVYGAASDAEWRFLEHAGWVFFEDAFLITACAHGLREMRSTAQRQAELQVAKDDIEQATAEMSRQSAVLNSVLVGMNDGVIVADPHGNFLHFNPAAERILGKGAQDVPIGQWSEVYGLYPDGSDTPIASGDLPLARAIQGDSIDHEEIRVKRARLGDEVWIEVSGQPLLDAESARCGGVVVFRDVTERRKLLEEFARAREQAEQANGAKSEFLSRMSHELRTPMNSILGFGQLLQMENLTEDQQDSVKQIVMAGSHLLKLINEVLDISRIDSGTLTISREAVDVLEVVREVASLLSPLAQMKGVAVVVPNGTKGDVFAMADQQRLLQVLLNLLSNAIKYNVNGGRVEVEIEPKEESWRIRVQDTGIGISPEKEALIFTPFERLGAEQTSVEGTGLGLALSKRLMEAMGGRIGIEPCATGTCFYIELPMARCPLQAIEGTAPLEALSSGPAPNFRRTVLLIEDNPSNVRLVEKILQGRAEYRLLVARDGRVGIDLAHEHEPDLILLDLNLPDIGGQEVLRHLKGDPKLARIPVAVVSADATPSQVERLLASGAAAYMTKPIDVRGFLSLLTDLDPSREKKSA